MGKKVDRNTLREYFKKGKTPSGTEFDNFIESVPNFEENDFVHFGKNGFAVFTKDEGQNGAVLEVYKNKKELTTGNPCWTFNLDSDESLTVNDKKGAVVKLAQKNSRKVTVSSDVEVDGVMRFSGENTFPIIKYSGTQPHYGLVIVPCQTTLPVIETSVNTDRVLFDIYIAEIGGNNINSHFFVYCNKKNEIWEFTKIPNAFPNGISLEAKMNDKTKILEVIIVNNSTSSNFLVVIS